MIEFERQISEAPDICIVVCGYLGTIGKLKGKPIVWVRRYTSESGEEIPAWFGNHDEYASIEARYSEEIQAVKDEVSAQLLVAKNAAHEK